MGSTGENHPTTRRPRNPNVGFVAQLRAIEARGGGSVAGLVSEGGAGGSSEELMARSSVELSRNKRGTVCYLFLALLGSKIPWSVFS